MRNALCAALLVTSLPLFLPAPAQACGGFFCSASPVDQNAERIVFAIDEATDSTEMVVQIAYQGEDEAFAWLLPVGAVPQDRGVFPSGALAPLDAQTGPVFQSMCWGGGPVPASLNDDGGDFDEEAGGSGGVIIHVQETVGPYDIAVIESADASRTFEWLVTNGYRLSPVMKPYIELYTEQQMKFLALKLTADASASDIQPFRMRLPGTTPSIPLRLTAIAAEPEMSVVVWILGQRRYEPANAEEIEIAKSELRWDPNSGWPIRTNWSELVARKVDEQGGRGWVVEQAGSTAELEQNLMNTFVQDEDQEAARDALLGLVQGRPYMTRLYTRVAAEEMSYDPTFRRSDKGNVSQVRELPDDVCTMEGEPSVDPCDFSACGQLGLCGEVMDATTKSRVAACACAPGSTARTTFDPQGRPTITCQDQRMSFMNPGEKDESGVTFADPCVGFSCGDHGRCVSMNLTPTCECDAGYVAVGALSESGARETECVQPLKAVPKSFYNRRPPELAAGMVAGRSVTLEPAAEGADVPMADTYGLPMLPKPSAGSGEGKGGCSVDASGHSGLGAAWFAALGLGLMFWRRRA